MKKVLPLLYDELNVRQKRELREEYIEAQDGLCYHCGCSLNKDAPTDDLGRTINTALFPKGFFNNPVHLHHSHQTGRTIGAVHAECNAILWQYHGE